MTRWALIATEEIDIPNPDPDAVAREATVKVPSGTIVNFIMYDGVSDYLPPSGTRLAIIEGDREIGDTA